MSEVSLYLYKTNKAISYTSSEIVSILKSHTPQIYIDRHSLSHVLFSSDYAWFCVSCL